MFAQYLAAHANEAINQAQERPWLILGLAAIWHEITARYAGFLLSDPVWLMSAIWSADFVLGSAIAIKASLRKEPVGRWSPRRALQSVAKWALWISVLFVCFTLRSSGKFGFGPFAALIESAIILAEATSALRNAGKLTGARWLERFASAGESAINNLADQAEHLADKKSQPQEAHNA